jgi:4-amino-4-deoxychorismate lyase
MSLLVESIKIQDGILFNINYHSERFNRTRKELFGTGIPVDLQSKIVVPAYCNKGLFKCRIEYDEHIRKIDFNPYEYKRIRTLRLVEGGDITYDYKYIDRKRIDELKKKNSDCDDIIIVKDGRITDSSYANIILRGNDNRWYTPSTTLLNGTKRAYLLDKEIVKIKEVTPASLRKFRELRLINAMMDINDSNSIPIKSICF